MEKHARQRLAAQIVAVIALFIVQGALRFTGHIEYDFASLMGAVFNGATVFTTVVATGIMMDSYRHFRKG